MDFTEAVERLAERVKQDGIAECRARDVGCKANLDSCETRVTVRRKYTLVDQGRWYDRDGVRTFGGSGRFMVENSTGVIYGIKGYGKVHKGHSYGRLDTITDWNWGPYYPVRKHSIDQPRGGTIKPAFRPIPSDGAA